MKWNDSSKYRRATTVRAKEKLVLQGLTTWKWHLTDDSLQLQLLFLVDSLLQQVIVTFHPFCTFMQLSHVKLFGCFLKETTKIYRINF